MRAGLGERRRHIIRVEAACQQPWFLGFDHAKQAPVEALPIASRPSAGLARLGIEQQIIRDGIELRNRSEIGGLADPDRLHDGKAKAGTNGGYAFRSFAPMQLKELRIERGDRRRERCVVGIDRQQNLARLARGPRPRLAACSKEMCLGLLSKKTKPTMSAPCASAASSPASVARPQILIRTLMGIYPEPIKAIFHSYHGREVFAGVAAPPRRFPE